MDSLDSLDPLDDSSDFQVGDLVWLKPTKEGPFVITAVWNKGCGIGDKADNTWKTLTDEACLVLANVDNKPLEKPASGYWFGTAKIAGCSIILRNVCTKEELINPGVFSGAEGTFREFVALTQELGFSFWSTMAVIAFSLAAIIVALSLV